MARAAAALIFMLLCFLIFTKCFKKYFPNAVNNASGAVKIEILSSLRLTSRDIFYVIRVGSDVIAFTLSQGGACLLGKWSYENLIKNTEKLEIRNEE